MINVKSVFRFQLINYDGSPPKKGLLHKMAPLHKKKRVFINPELTLYIVFLIQSHPSFWDSYLNPNHHSEPLLTKHAEARSPTFLPWNYMKLTLSHHSIGKNHHFFRGFQVKIWKKHHFFRGFQVRSSPRQPGRRPPLVRLRCPGEAGDGRGAARPLRGGHGATGVFGGPAVPPSAAGEEAWQNVEKWHGENRLQVN